MTEAQQKALRALIAHGGEGIMTRAGTMLARGVELGHGPDNEGSRDNNEDFFQRSTWKALIDLGYIKLIGPRRYRVVGITR